MTNNGLVPIIKISGNNHGKGYGYKAFCELIKYFGDIMCICASWNKDKEHDWCKDGMSTNLRIFKQKKAAGFSDMMRKIKILTFYKYDRWTK